MCKAVHVESFLAPRPKICFVGEVSETSKNTETHSGWYTMIAKLYDSPLRHLGLDSTHPSPQTAHVSGLNNYWNKFYADRLYQASSCHFPTPRSYKIITDILHCGDAYATPLTREHTISLTACIEIKIQRLTTEDKSVRDEMRTDLRSTANHFLSRCLSTDHFDLVQGSVLEHLEVPQIVLHCGLNIAEGSAVIANVLVGGRSTLPNVVQQHGISNYMNKLMILAVI